MKKKQRKYLFVSFYEQINLLKQRSLIKACKEQYQSISIVEANFMILVLRTGFNS